MKQELMPLSKKILRVGFNLGALLFIVLGKLVCIIINVEMCLRREVELWFHFFCEGGGGGGASASESGNSEHKALSTKIVNISNRRRRKFFRFKLLSCRIY